MDIASRHVLVTGGTSGIGRAIASAFVHAGCSVVAAGLLDDSCSNRDDSRSNVSDGEEPRLAMRHLDVRDEASVRRVLADFARLDVLVNAAGTILREGREHDPQCFAAVVDVNLNGMMRVCNAAREKLFLARGCVINIASMLSFFGSGFVPAYSASKGGVVQLTRSLAIAWAPHGVRVNAVAPGWIETPMTQPLYDDPQRRQQILERTPLGRWGRPEDVAGAVVFLASPAAEFITGVVLPVDGGYSSA